MEMRPNLAGGLAVAVLLATSVVSAAGQDYKSSVGWNAGVLYTTAMNDGATASGGEAVEIKPEMTWTIGLHYDYWLWSGFLGVRIHGAWAQQDVTWIQGTREVYVYTADLDLMLRPLRPTSTRSVSPYLALGVGGIRWKLGDGPATSYPPAGAVYPGEEKFELIGVGGVGIDFVTPWSWGENPLVIRLDGRDQVQIASPFEPTDPADDEFGLIHNFQVTLGLHTGIGWLRGG